MYKSVWKHDLIAAHVTTNRDSSKLLVQQEKEVKLTQFSAIVAVG